MCPYFCKTFRAETGCTPQEYRLRHGIHTAEEDL